MQEKCIEGYRILGCIGEGAHGLVLKAIQEQSNKYVALKVTLIKNLDEGIPLNIVREVLTLRHLRCKYITKMYEMFPHGMHIVLVLEYMYSSLWEMLNKSHEELTLPLVKRYTMCMLKGVAYMHDHSVMHRDLKPANLLINSQGILKIGDLGLARLYWPDGDRPYSSQVASRWYRAPELLYGATNYTKSVDLWAVGCIVGEMLIKKPVFPGESDIKQLAIVLGHLGTPTPENWPGIEDLPDYHKISFTEYSGVSWDEILPNVDAHSMQFVQGVLSYNQNKRMTAIEALKSSWFKSSPMPTELDRLPRPIDRKPLETC